MSNYRDFNIGDVQSSAGGLDAFFEDTPEVVTPYGIRAAKKKETLSGPTLQAASSRKKVASLEQLEGFVRTASDTLVHKSNQDLWSLQKDEGGSFFIERKFDSSGGPVKG